MKRSKVTLTGDEIIEQLEYDLGLTTRESNELFAMMFAELKESIMQEEDTRLTGLGNFRLEDRSDGKAVKFKPSPRFKDRIISYHLAKMREDTCP